MSTRATEVRDLDHVVMADGRIYRVAGNQDHPAKSVGYNVYPPDPAGDRVFRGQAYRKNFTEDDELPGDALDTYVILPKARICGHLDPHTAAAEKASTFADSPWAGLHAELNDLAGADSVGIFGSAMLGMHLAPDGAVRTPYQLACAFPAQASDVTVTGQVTDADLGNLFPRMFRLVTAGHAYTVHLWWWKFASPVRDGDTITVRGSRRDLPGHDVIRISSFTSHWLKIHNP